MCELISPGIIALFVQSIFSAGVLIVFGFATFFILFSSIRMSFLSKIPESGMRVIAFCRRVAIFISHMCSI